MYAAMNHGITSLKLQASGGLSQIVGHPMVSSSQNCPATGALLSRGGADARPGPESEQEDIPNRGPRQRGQVVRFVNAGAREMPEVTLGIGWSDIGRTEG